MRSSEEKTHEVAERLRRAVKHAPVGMALKDAAGRVLWSNPALRDMLGYGEDELRGMFRTKFTHSEDLGEDARLYEEILRGERESFRLEKRYVKKDGGVTWGRLSVFRVEEELNLVLLLVEDIEGQKQAEEDLAAQERRFRTVIEQAPLSIHVFEPGGRSLRANSAWNELWHLGEGEAPEGSNVYTDEQLRATGLVAYIEESKRKGAAVRTPPLLHDPAKTGRAGPDRLFLEVTESAAMEDAPATILAFERFRNVRVRAIIDDFGTGYSSLSYLGRFPVDYVKIDRSFVVGLGDHSLATLLAKGVIDLTHALGLGVIAEGVETEGQLEQLREMGCDLAQGFYFSEPLTGDAVKEWLASRRIL